MSRYLALIATLLAGVVPEASGQAGAFTRMGFGARGVALSSALVADAFGDGSAYYNPALAPMVEQQSLEATAALLTLDRKLQFIQFSAPLRPRAGITAGLIQAGVSGIDGRDESGYHTQEYSTDEMAFFLAFGLRLGGRLTGGFTFQLFRARLFESLDAVTSLGLDLGFTARVTEALRLGVAVDDLLANYAWNTSTIFGGQGRSTSDRFPTRIRFGGAYNPGGGRLLLLAEYESRITAAEYLDRETGLDEDIPRERTVRRSIHVHDPMLRFGAEYRLAEPFALRAGVDRIGTDGIKPSAGFMIQESLGNLPLRAEYAFALEPYDTLPMHFVTLRVFL